MSPIRSIMISAVIVSVVHCSVFRDTAYSGPKCPNALTTKSGHPVRVTKTFYYTYDPKLHITPIINAMTTINKFLGFDYLNLSHTSLTPGPLGNHIGLETLSGSIQARNQFSYKMSGNVTNSIIIVNDTLVDTDLESVYLHEFLHTMGLDHIKPDDLNEVMNWGLSKHQQRRVITPQASITLKCIYGKGGIK